MELRDFALRVLLTDSLAEKLAPPAEPITDDHPGAAIHTPDSPGRPASLRMARRGLRARLPPENELHRDEPRAVLLHFFANHELLATELMALAILRFPEAPPAFRRALLQTLLEEQVHTRLYMDLMARGGLALGDLPVNGYFWRQVSGMESPVDYVSRLSLTFEQANLDYSHHFAGVFGRMGDTHTAALMQRIYEDEIGHVGRGLHWLRKWKMPGESDFAAWQKVLHLPLSPAQARGRVPFNAEGRRRAGLDDSFIASVEDFGKSRRSAPGVFLFNPGAERAALARDPDAGRNDRATAGLARDLDLLPLLLCRAGDVVLVQRRPSEEHLRSLAEAGLPSAELEVLDASGRLAADSPLRTRKLSALRPWGWSPDSAEVLAPLAAGARTSLPWNDAIRAIYSKATAARLLAGLGSMPDAAALAGIPCETPEETEDAISMWFRKGHAAVLLKAPWGLAGRGHLKVLPGAPPATQTVWIKTTLSEQKCLVVEPWLDRVADFSAHYDVAPGQPPKLRGMVRLVNDSSGRFVSCIAGRHFQRLMPAEATRALERSRAHHFYRDILPHLLTAIIGDSGFRGWLGVDAFLHRDAMGHLLFRPVVEINPRGTMGRATLEARRFAAPGSPVAWRIYYQRHAREAGLRTLAEFSARIRAAHPVVLKDGRLLSGAVCLNDPDKAGTFLGVLLAGEAAQSCCQVPGL
ncbi:MAG: ferritin-like domain-containing protein [Planctomycetes bacterium]|nr:ferritin-like domain-containing protein [Planctomycetota bacterium]